MAVIPRILLSLVVFAVFLTCTVANGPESGRFSFSVCQALSNLTELRVLPQVATDKRQVALLDLCDSSNVPDDWKNLMARTNIGEGPALGSEKYVDPAMLRTYLCQFIDSQGADSSRVEIRLPDRITVTRQSVQLSDEQIEGIFRKFIMENAPWKPEDMVIRKVSYSGLPVLPTGKMTYEVIPAQRERFAGNVSISVNFIVNGEKVRTLGITGRVDVYQNIYHASRALKQNDIVTPADLELQRINITESPDDYVTRPDQALNNRIVRGVRLHEPITLKDVDKPLVLKRGDPVTIVYAQPGIHVTAKGLAKEDGAQGATIRISNVKSNKIISCRVLDSETVQAIR